MLIEVKYACGYISEIESRDTIFVLTDPDLVSVNLPEGITEAYLGSNHPIDVKACKTLKHLWIDGGRA